MDNCFTLICTTVLIEYSGWKIIISLSVHCMPPLTEMLQFAELQFFTCSWCRLKKSKGSLHLISLAQRHHTPEIEITGGHWSLPEHLGQMTAQVWISSDNISYMMYIGGQVNIPLTGQLSRQISILIWTCGNRSSSVYCILLVYRTHQHPQHGCKI